MLEALWSWLFRCTTIPDRVTGEGSCAQPNLLVLLVPAGLVVAYAALRWAWHARRGRVPPRLVTPAMRVVVVGSLVLISAAALFGPSGQ